MRVLRRWIQAVYCLSFVPPAWRLPTFAILGVAVGMGLLLVRVSEFPSYLSDSPRTCINCHIMVPEYATWQRSSHRAVTVCNDCHVPHDSLVRKYAFKAKDGMRHATIFALRREPQVIVAHPASVTVIEENCLRCHSPSLAQVPSLHDSGRRCTDCHREVPHGDVHGLASTPNIPFPHLPPVSSLPGSP